MTVEHVQLHEVHYISQFTGRAHTQPCPQDITTQGQLLFGGLRS